MKPGAVIRLVDSQDVINNSVQRRYEEDGTRKIPFHPHLGDAASDEQRLSARRFILLATYEARYESFEGIGGLGLVPAAKRKKVLAALKH